MNKITLSEEAYNEFKAFLDENKVEGYNIRINLEVGSQPCRSVSQGVGRMFCLPKTAWPSDF